SSVTLASRPRSPPRAPPPADAPPPRPRTPYPRGGWARVGVPNPCPPPGRGGGAPAAGPRGGQAGGGPAAGGGGAAAPARRRGRGLGDRLGIVEARDLAAGRPDEGGHHEREGSLARDRSQHPKDTASPAGSLNFELEPAYLGSPRSPTCRSAARGADGRRDHG